MGFLAGPFGGKNLILLDCILNFLKSELDILRLFEIEEIEVSTARFDFGAAGLSSRIAKMKRARHL